MITAIIQNPNEEGAEALSEITAFCDTLKGDEGCDDIDGWDE